MLGYLVARESPALWCFVIHSALLVEEGEMGWMHDVSGEDGSMG